MSAFTEAQLAEINAAVAARVDLAEGAADAHWVLYCGVLVFLMQSGFAMLCAGRGLRVRRAPRGPRGFELKVV